MKYVNNSLWTNDKIENICIDICLLQDFISQYLFRHIPNTNSFEKAHRNAISYDPSKSEYFEGDCERNFITVLNLVQFKPKTKCMTVSK